MDVDSFSKLILLKRRNVFFEKECVSAIMIVVSYDEKYLFLTLISAFWNSNMSVLDLPIGSYEFFGLNTIF